MDNLNKKYPNEILVENTPSLNTGYDEQNEVTLTTPYPTEHPTFIKKTSSINTEKYDIEHGGLSGLEVVKSNITIASMIELPNPDDEFYETIPDGGYGWVVAIVGFLTNFIMFGTASVWGVFSNAYATTILKDKATTIELMGVGSTMIVCLNIFTPLGPILDHLFGTRIVMTIGSIVLSLGIILAGFSTEVWHLYLTQGVLFGFGSSLVYMSIVAVIPQWFTTRRGAAMGISSAGTGFGGLALSPMVTSLVSKYGLPWTYRIIGLMSLGVCMLASLLMKTRLPPNHKNQPLKFPIKPSMLKDWNFILCLAGLVISLTGYLIPLFYIPKYCTSLGISAANSSTIVGVACAMNAVGRIVLGYVGDRIGRLNIYVIASVCAGLFCMLLWPFAKTFGTMMAFAVLFGFTCGIYFAAAAPIVASVVGHSNISSGLSILFLVSAISGTGPPIASAIQEASADGSFIGVQMFSGAVYIFGSAICIAMKVKMTGSFFSIM